MTGYWVSIYRLKWFVVGKGKCSASKLPNGAETLLAIDSVVAMNSSLWEPSQINFWNIHAPNNGVYEQDLALCVPGSPPLPSRIQVDPTLFTDKVFDSPAYLLDLHSLASLPPSPYGRCCIVDRNKLRAP